MRRPAFEASLADGVRFFTDVLEFEKDWLRESIGWARSGGVGSECLARGGAYCHVLSRGIQKWPV